MACNVRNASQCTSPITTSAIGNSSRICPAASSSAATITGPPASTMSVRASRSGATIVAALLLGSDKRAATEFTFFLAMPTMAGAFAYDLYKNWANLSPEDIKGIALGFVVSFIAGVIVVRYLLGFVSRHGFAPFAWWRIIVGGMGLGALAVLG